MATDFKVDFLKDILEVFGEETHRVLDNAQSTTISGLRDFYTTGHDPGGDYAEFRRVLAGCIWMICDHFGYEPLVQIYGSGEDEFRKSFEPFPLNDSQNYLKYTRDKMLSYEDSVALRDLGYPQELKDGDWYYYQIAKTFKKIDRPIKLYVGDAIDELHSTVGYVKVPTTDGMIEGLGNLLHILENINKAFRAYSKPVDKADVSAYGRTADQALCELWKKVKGESNA